MAKLRDVLLILAVVMPFAGCDDDDDGPPPVAAAGSIGPAGGTVQVTDGDLAGAAIEIPAGALASTVDISFFEDLVSLMPGFLDVGPAVRLEPNGMALALPAVLTLPFDPALVPAPTTPADFVVRLRLADGRVFDATPQQVDQGLGLVTVEVVEFATWWVSVPDKIATRDYLPLADGDRYQYDSGLRLTVSATRSEPNFLGVPLLKLTFSTPFAFFLGMYLVEDGDGALSLVGEFEVAFDNRQERLASPALLLDPVETVGAHRAVFYTFTGFVPYGGPVPVYTGAANTLVSISGRESLVTPAGSFEDVVELVLATDRSDTRPRSSTHVLRLWLANGIGPVQVQMDENAPTALVLGTVGGMPIGSQPRRRGRRSHAASPRRAGPTAPAAILSR